MRSPRWSKVPWWLPDTDLRPSHNGELKRECRSDAGDPQRHFLLHVVQQFHPETSLGYLAIRCQRLGDQSVPLTVSIPDGAIALPETGSLNTQSGGPRSDRQQADGFSEEEGDAG